MQLTRMQQAWQAFNQSFWEKSMELARLELAIQPDSIEARLLIGVAAVKAGMLDEGIRSLQEVIRLQPDNFDALNWLSFAHCKSRNYDEALRLVKNALLLQPRNADAFGNQGLALLGLERYDEAVGAFRRAVSLAPNSETAHYNLGSALTRQGKPMDALTAFKDAAQFSPSPRASLLKQVEVLEGLNRWHESRVISRRLTKMYPEIPEGYAGLGWADVNLGRARDGVAALRKAVEIDPKPQHLTKLGVSLQSIGEFEEAKSLFLASIQSEPNYVPATLALATNGTDMTQFPDVLAGAERMLTESKLEKDDAASLHFALGKTFDQTGDYERAIGHYDAGNAIRYDFHRQSKPFLPVEYKKVFARLPEDFKRLRDQIPLGFGNPSGVPVFVVGMIRSGTTLMHQILTSAGEFEGVGELGFLVQDGFMSPEVAQGTLSVPGLKQATESYLEEVRSHAPEAQHIVDKLPGNYAVLGLIHLAFPKAKIIHMVRDPIDTCLSIWMTPNRTQPSWGHHRGHIVTAYVAYEQLMNHWRAIIPRETMIEVGYEQLVNDGEGVTKEVAAFLGVPWTANFLEFRNNPDAVLTPSVWQVRQPLFTSSIGRGVRYAKWTSEFQKAKIDKP